MFTDYYVHPDRRGILLDPKWLLLQQGKELPMVVKDGVFDIDVVRSGPFFVITKILLVESCIQNICLL